MAVAVVAWMGVGSNVGKVVAANADNGWDGSLNVDTINFVEGTASLGEKVSATTTSLYTVNTTDVVGEPFDFSGSGGNDGDHIFGWLNIFAAWDTLAAGGFGLRVADNLATDSRGTWYVGPQTGYLGGWASYVINPSADFDAVVAGTASWTTNGNPAQLSGVDGFGCRWKVTTSITGNTDNAFVDCISVGQGYRITLGDSGSAEGVFDDFVTFEDNVTNGRFGGLREIGGILFAKGKLLIGAASGSTNTEFIDSGFTVVWEQQTLSDGTSSAVADGFYEFSFSQGTGTTDVDLSSGTLSTVAPHDIEMDWSGVNSVTADLMTINRARTITLDSACSLTNSTISNSGLITLGEADLSGSSILTPTVAADEGAVFDDRTTTVATSISELDNCTFSKGTNSHHAIRFGTGVDDDITLTGIEFTGFGTSEDGTDAALRFDATTGSMDCNLIGCTVGGAVATAANLFKDDAAGIDVTLVFDPVTLTVHVDDEDGNDLQSARVYLRAADGTGPFPFQDSVTIARSGTEATVSHTAHGMAVGDKFIVKGITDKEEDNNGVKTIATVPGANSYTYTTTDSGSTSYTGTIVSTWVALDENTDVNGDAVLTQTIASNQPVTGWVRKSTSGTRYKSFAISGTIDSSAGLSINVQMIPDE